MSTEALAAEKRVRRVTHPFSMPRMLCFSVSAGTWECGPVSMLTSLVSRSSFLGHRWGGRVASVGGVAGVFSHRSLD